MYRQPNFNEGSTFKTVQLKDAKNWGYFSFIRRNKINEISGGNTFVILRKYKNYVIIGDGKNDYTIERDSNLWWSFVKFEL